MSEISTRPWRIRHLDLSERLPRLAAEPGAAGVLLVFWWGDVPLGQAVLPAEQLPLEASFVRWRALDTITPAVGDRLFANGFRPPLPEHSAPTPEDPGPQVLRQIEDPCREAAARVRRLEEKAPPDSTAVIICTRKRPEELRACLESIAELDPGPDELIVVDNAPEDDLTQRTVDGARELGIDIVYVPEPRRGLSAARNAGIRASSAEILAFTDDDVVVHPRWLLRLRAALASPNVMAATGLVLPAELETRAQQLFQWNHGGYAWSYRAQTFDRSFLERTRMRGTPVWHIGAGASMAFKRQAFLSVGGFDERLGAGASGCSEDSEMWHRLLVAGHACRYEPSSVVFHTHRRSMEGLERQLHDYMRGHVMALFTQFELDRHPGHLLRAGFWLPRYLGGWMLRRALGRSGGPSLLGAQVRGFLAGFRHYLQYGRAPAIPQFTEPERS